MLILHNFQQPHPEPSNLKLLKEMDPMEHYRNSDSLLESCEFLSCKIRYLIHAVTRVFKFSHELFASLPNQKLQDHTLSAIRDCLLNNLPANINIGGRSYFRKLRTCHAVVTGTDWEVGCGDREWIDLAQDRDRCRAQIRVPQSAVNFFSSCEPFRFSIMCVLCGVSQ